MRARDQRHRCIQCRLALSPFSEALDTGWDCAGRADDREAAPARACAVWVVRGVRALDWCARGKWMLERDCACAWEYESLFAQPGSSTEKVPV